MREIQSSLTSIEHIERIVLEIGTDRKPVSQASEQVG